MLKPDLTKDDTTACEFAVWEHVQGKYVPCPNPVIDAIQVLNKFKTNVCEWHKAMFTKGLQ